MCVCVCVCVACDGERYSVCGVCVLCDVCDCVMVWCVRIVTNEDIKVGSQYDTRTYIASRYFVLRYIVFRCACSQYRQDTKQYVTPPNSSTTPPTYISYRLVYKT